MDKIKKMSLSKYFWILSIICFVDLALTTIGLQTGVLFEANWMLAWTLKIGLWFFILYKIVLQGVGIAILEWHTRKYKDVYLYKCVIVLYLIIWILFFVYYNFLYLTIQEWLVLHLT